MKKLVRLLLVSCGFGMQAMPSLAQDTLAGLGLDPNAGWAFKPRGTYNARTFEFMDIKEIKPDGGSLQRVEASVYVIFRPHEPAPEAGAVAMQVDRSMDCGFETKDFVVTSVTIYGAGGEVLSQGNSIPAAYADFAPNNHYRLNELAVRCQPNRPWPKDPTLIVMAGRESAVRRVSDAKTEPPVNDVPGMLAWAERREADYTFARELSSKGRFIITLNGKRPLIIDLSSRTKMGEEQRVTVVGFADKELGWQLRATARVNCAKQTVIPEYQADYDLDGQLQGFRRLGQLEYAMPGIDSYGAMFAPVCAVKDARFGQTVYKTLPEAVDAARRTFKSTESSP